jgi:small-conductance mechanosensitive channel
MSRLYLRLICLIFLPLLASSASAQVRLMPNLEATEEARLPELGSLKTGWWDYFAANAGAAADRHAEFLVAVEAVIRSGSPQQREEGQQLLSALETNFATYRDLAGRKAFMPPSVPPASEEYSLDQLLRLLDGSRVVARQVADDELEMARARRRAESDRRSRDQAFKDYISQSLGDDRWLQGLRLVHARLYQATSDLRLEIVEAEYKAAQQVQDDFADRLSYAKSQLVVPAEEEDLKAIAKSQNDAQRARDEALKDWQKADLAAAQYVFSDEIGKAEARVLQHRAFSKGADYGLQEIVLMQIEAESWITRFFSESKPGLSQLKEQEIKWTAFSREISDERRQWQKDLEAEILLVQSPPNRDMERKERKLLEQRIAIATETLSKLNSLRDAQEDLGFTLDLLNEVAAGRAGRVERWVGVAYSQFLTARQWLGETSAATLFAIGESPITGNDVLTVFWIILIAVILSKSVRKGLARVGGGAETSSQAGLYTFGRLFHYFIIFVAILIALGSIGIDFSNLAFIAGALGVGIGFGLQNIVNNFVSGLIILFEGTLRVGDYIELDTGVTGTVKAINARSTLIKTNDNIDIIVPNADIASNKLTNWTLGEYILRMRIPFGVAYGTDKELVKKAAIEAANNVHFTLKNMKGRDPDVWLVEFGDSSMNYLLLVWVNRQGARRPTRTLATYLWALDDAFKEHGIEIPFPQRDLHLRSGFDKLPVPDENT